jgi:hypothetical protein
MGHCGHRICTAVVHAADGVLFVAVTASRDDLAGRVAAWVGARAGDRLWAEDAREVRALLGANHFREAIALYFARVGLRWDEEWLVEV